MKCDMNLILSESLRIKKATTKKGLRKKKYFPLFYCIAAKFVSDLSITEDFLPTTTLDCYCEPLDENCYEKCLGDERRYYKNFHKEYLLR